MICLDTNYLIRGLMNGAYESTRLIEWYESGEILLSAAPSWFEFLCGPVTKPQINVVRAFLSGGISAFEEVQATEAARLFNAVRRVRRFRVDAMIAATAIVAGARFATSNIEDFNIFVPHGLELIQ
ncbi:MAG: PIN domain-containing protein [Verrucomicrobia bacterium]|nr:PIN domain-containing protein [Verrucomicrobiota bacterium]